MAAEMALYWADTPRDAQVAEEAAAKSPNPPGTAQVRNPLYLDSQRMGRGRVRLKCTALPGTGSETVGVEPAAIVERPSHHGTKPAMESVMNMVREKRLDILAGEMLPGSMAEEMALESMSRFWKGHEWVLELANAKVASRIPLGVS